MKTVLVMIMALSVAALAGYTYEIKDGEYFIGESLTGTQSMLVTGGGGLFLNLYDSSRADIFNTSSLQEGYGGIWQIVMGGYSQLMVENGEIHELAMSSYSMAQIRGGRINQIWSSQNATITKHIELICKAGYIYNPTTGYLSGLWADNSFFNIYLANAPGTSLTIDNIKFTIIPEPATFLLIALGGLLLRCRRN